VLDDGGRKLVVGYEIGCIRAGYRHWQRNATIAMTMPFEMTEVSGSGWAELDGPGDLAGEFSFHLGDGDLLQGLAMVTFSAGC
jgi:hypothetical protein